MGGDHAPVEIVAGAIESDVDVILVGDRPQLEPLLDGASLEIVHAPDVIGMHEDPGAALREKRQSSIAVAAKLVADGEADGMVSAGSTGAALAAAALIIGRAKNVIRPAIAAVLPGGESGQIVLDAGANPEVKPEHLLQFAVMGDALARTRLGLKNPRIGLLNIGEEEGKGRDLEKQAFDLIEEQTGLNFIGNVEGRDLASSRADVIVTDGFSGNVALKSSEGAVRLVVDAVKSELGAVVLDDPQIAARIAEPLSRLAVRLDPETYGGANLLGVRGLVTIAHGSSSRRAIVNALKMTAVEAEQRLIEEIATGLSQ